MMGQGRSQGVPTTAPDDNRPADQTIALVAQNLRYQPSRVELKAGQTVRFVITNRDGFALNFISAEAGIGERVIAVRAPLRRQLLPASEGQGDRMCGAAGPRKKLGSVGDVQNDAQGLNGLASKVPAPLGAGIEIVHVH